ncbi:MAG: acyl-CoA/acyl-ACP dehydrogenase [Novosphingobium sp.]|nr:acyl-CoA/acyl-ACP dehydrogenase [Novosphingobium sp.]
MTTIGAEERAAIREGFARLLAEKCSETDVRRIMATPSGHDPELWNAISGMGITALIVDPDHGGIGAGPVELETIMEEAGAALLAGPLLSSAVLAAGLLGESGDDAAKARLLPGIASGQTIATVALTGDSGTWTPEGVAVTANAQGGLDGTASFVVCANVAHVLLVVARTADGVGCFEIAADAPGVAITPLETWDRTIRLSRIVFSGAQATRIGGIDAAAVERALDLGRVALAGEQAGAARRIFEITIEYLKTRVQFGRPIGGFQAMKHMAADLLIDVESATSAARAAAQALASDTPDKAVLVNLAAFACADAFSQVAATAIQMHGGIAFTWEHPAHLYLRRARVDAQLFGQSELYRERYLAAMENAA